MIRVTSSLPGFMGGFSGVLPDSLEGLDLSLGVHRTSERPGEKKLYVKVKRCQVTHVVEVGNQVQLDLDLSEVA